MNVRRIAAIAGLALFALAWAAPASQEQPGAITIGMGSSMFRDLTPAKVDSIIPEFEGLFFDLTGLKGRIVRAGDSADVAKKLHEKVVLVGVFQGFEFAWARQSYPDLKPLVIAVERQRSLKAMVVVLKDNKAKSLTDLKGQVLSIPNRCPEYCHLFLQRELGTLGSDQKEFFGKVLEHPSAEDALDDLLRNKVQAVLVDGNSLDLYAEVNPGRHARLRTLTSAEGFPPGLMAYREGGLDQATLVKIKKGLMNASTTVKGKEQLVQWRLSGFEEVPADYEKMLADILKRYPATVAAKTK
jgi:ABC-type phosphate/phosphonate transport system substrate-binding protein